jgi:chromosome segregation ATPase
VRITRADDYSAVTTEVAKLERDLAELRERRQQLATELQEALGRDAAHYSEQHVLQLRRAVNAADERLALAADHIAAVRAKLPTDANREASRAEAAKIAAALEAARKRFRTGWGRYMDAMGAAETAARAALADRAEAQSLGFQLADLSARYGLDLMIPEVPVGPDSKAAYLLGTLLTQAAMGEVDATLETDLAAARQAFTKAS